MWREPILTTALARLNAPVAPELRERLGDLRPLWLIGRWAVVAALAATVCGIALGAGWPWALPLLLLAVLLLNELHITIACRIRSERGLDLWLFVYGLLLLSWAALATYATVDVSWLGLVLFALVVAGHGTVLKGRALLPFVAFASLAFAVAVRASGGPWAEGALGGVAPLFALVAVPLIGALAYGTGTRVRFARRRAEQSARDLDEAQQQLAESHEELLQWSEHLEEEVARKTQELEERNRHLSIVNATSFALREAIDDAPTLERALRLVARLLETRAAQTYLREREYALGNLTLVASDASEPKPAAVPDRLLEEVTASAQPVFSGDKGIDESPSLGNLSGFAVVPLTAKGRSLGALAVSGRAEIEWSEPERRLVMLIGREVSSAVEQLLLYRAALSRAGRESLLNEVTRVLNAEPDASRAVASALELVAQRLRAEALSVVGPIEGRRAHTVLAQAPPLAADSIEGPRGLPHGALQAAPALVLDRAKPLVLGVGGEAPRSDGAPGTLVIAPLPLGASGGGALVASAPADASWGANEAELLGRLAEMIAQRLQAAELVRLQRRRIAELAGLAKVAQTMQSTVDLDRLLTGFARAIRELLPLRTLQIARLSEDGRSATTTTVRHRGDELSHGPADGTDVTHPWFALRGSLCWSRGAAQPAAFVVDDADHAVVVPMRSKGRVLGVAVLVTEEAPTRDQEQLAEQAVGQLALALESVSLYQQATQRAARIQVLGNLARIVASVMDLSEAFDAFSEEVRWLIPFDRALILRVNREAGTVQASAAYPNATVTEEARPLAGSVAERVLAAEGPVLLRRLDRELVELDWSVFGEDTAELATVPLPHGDGETAIFALAHGRRDSYREEEVALLDEVGRLLSVSIERVRLFEQSERTARHDLLTGLPNYRYLHERLAELRMSIERGAESALILIDMDDLKLFNDTLGHSAGDQAIELVGREIRRACRLQDFVARVGGDEFVVVMEGATLRAAMDVAERVHEALRGAHVEIRGAPTAIRVSAGIAMAPSDALDVEALLQAADGAMYSAKDAGGGLTRTAASMTDQELSRRRRTRARPSRVAEALIREVLAAASDDERAAAALADRYAVAVVAEKAEELPAETVPLLRMMVAVRASERIAVPHPSADWKTAITLVEGLRRRSQEASPGQMDLAEQVAEGAIALAWLELPPDQAGGVERELALRLFEAQTPELDAGVRAVLIELARAGVIEQRAEPQAA